ncbi:hypothetical protein AAFF_G00156810 [Aldrovandia affinis]|uniref:BHLH domain-containing protein n=1 Tax=Aldrovandia affinis TaxID=143900 RepID=A0AAD7RN99_9TELE|nr:hypothetical protein AAFF_G00156810 [Aldrovandia affinis]
MKTITTELPDQKDVRRIPKPLMEKRRRDRINNSLETLRLLLLENTHNEKLRNPKVEKAEILESVVHFLKAEQDGGHDPWLVCGEQRDKPGGEDEEVKSPSKHHSYREGMRTCLLRVGNFIAAKSHELEESGGECSPPKSPLPHVHSLPCPPLPGETCLPAAQGSEPRPGHCVPPLQTLPRVQPAPLRPSLGLTRLPQRTVPCPAASRVLSNASSGVPASKSSAVLSDAVWRPWPQ